MCVHRTGAGYKSACRVLDTDAPPPPATAAVHTTRQKAILSGNKKARRSLTRTKAQGTQNGEDQVHRDKECMLYILIPHHSHDRDRVRMGEVQYLQHGDEQHEMMIAPPSIRRTPTSPPRPPAPPRTPEKYRNGDPMTCDSRQHTPTRPPMRAKHDGCLGSAGRRRRRRWKRAGVGVRLACR